MIIEIKDTEVHTDRESKILRSEFDNEFISRKSDFFAKWSLFIFLFIIISILSITWFIKYPDVVTTRATIIAHNNPKEILTLKNGRLLKLFYKNTDTLASQSIIGYLEADADHEQIIKLDKKLDSMLIGLQKNNLLFHIDDPQGGFDSLGELQSNYQQFITDWLQYKDYIGNGYFIKKRNILEGDIGYLKNNSAILIEQKMLMEKDLKLSEESYSISEKLYKENILSKQDDRNEQSKLLGKRLTIPQINATILANQIQQREKQKEIYELEHTISQQKIQFRVKIQTFQVQVKEWLRKYIIKAPIAGQVNYLTPLQEGTYLSENKIFGYINPLGVNDFYAVATLPQKNFGKVHTDQLVQLRFDAYPYSEFGFVIGNLDYISEFATDSGFMSHIILPKGLITTQNKTISYHNGLKADAQVVTKDIRLLERFLFNLKLSTNR